MSKQLSPLEAFEGICCNTNQCYPDFKKQKDIVEKALKDYLKMLPEYEDTTKKLKAFDVIKRLLNEDCVSDLLHILRTYNKWEDYDYACDYNDENPILKSKEEFDLLKEVLL